MGNVKTYTIDYDWKAELTVEVDHDIVTDEALREINEFWSNHEWRESHHGLPVMETKPPHQPEKSIVIALCGHICGHNFLHTYNSS